MFNPNSLDELSAAIVDDLRFLGLVVNDETYSFLSVGNESMTLAYVRLCVERVKGNTIATAYIHEPHRDDHRRLRCTYKGEMEQFCSEVAQKTIKTALARRVHMERSVA